ncbi:MAG TPA: ribonuclease D [Mycobacteriales bacterium]|nr:ribonuclease D [Mycobacteriales bacterium]
MAVSTGPVPGGDVGGDPVPLLEPRDGVPDPLTDPDGLADAIRRFAAGSGPVAIDAERASGYRYTQRAYLVQLRRHGVGTVLVDPTALPDLSGLSAAIADAEWVLHAASQDLACLAEVGLRPRRLFDTELAGRLLGYPRVGLGIMVEEQLGLRLEKGYSAADWSTRPLPRSWLAYAALDVEVLVELRDLLEAQLVAQGKLDWAREEFEATMSAPPPPPRTDPWRRTSGMHKVRNRRQLAELRALWQTRDTIARDRDLAPGRVLPDSAIVAAVLAHPRTSDELLALPVFGGRNTRRLVHRWWRALTEARALDDSALPRQTVPSDAPPPANRWADRDPDAAARLASARTALATIAEQNSLPVENLLPPDVVRRLAWTPPEAPRADTVSAQLLSRGARSWQVDLTAHALANAMSARAPETG